VPAAADGEAGTEENQPDEQVARRLLGPAEHSSSDEALAHLSQQKQRDERHKRGQEKSFGRVKKRSTVAHVFLSRTHAIKHGVAA